MSSKLLLHFEEILSKSSEEIGMPTMHNQISNEKEINRIIPHVLRLYRVYWSYPCENMIQWHQTDFEQQKQFDSPET